MASNDLASLGLPFCDVLLSGLTISPGVLTPAFTPYQIAYTAAVGPSPITVTPANAHNAAIAFLGENDVLIPDADGALRYDLGGLTNGVSYDVLVRAVNAVGHGPWSPAATGTPRTTPGAPVIDSLIPGGGALNVGWSDPATDGGAEVTGYDLRFIRSDAPDKADANWTGRSGIWSSGPLRYDLGGLTDGVGYDVQVRAANAAGRGQWSGSITVTPL